MSVTSNVDDSYVYDAMRARGQSLFWMPSATVIEEMDRATEDLLARQITDPAHPQCGGWGDVTDAASPRLNYSLGQLVTLARSWGEPQSRWHHNDELASRITLAARFYASCLTPEEPFPNNWFFWQIGFLYELRDIFLMAEEAMDGDAHEQLLGAFRYLIDKIWDFHAPANRMYTAFSLLGFGLVTNEDAPLQKAAAWAEESTQYVEGRGDPQGFREDGTYFFHGARINLDYGITHLHLFAQLAYVLAGTKWQVSDAARARCTRLVLECAQWAIIGRRIDPFILDRSIAMPGDPAAAMVQKLLDAGLLLLGETPRADAQLLAFCARLMASGVEPMTPHTRVLASRLPAVAPCSLRGGRYFSEAEYCAVQGDGWAASVKMATWRTSTYAGINRLNRKGWHISDGQLVLRTSDNAFDETVFPSMDWERLSGITRADGFRIPHETMGHSWFSAGASTEDGRLTCCGLDFCIRMPDEQYELAARKNWFFLPDAIVATGSNIWTTAPVSIETVLRQVVLPPEWEEHTFEEGERELEYLVGHDCVYILPEKPKVKVWTEWREGDFGQIGAAEHANVKAKRRYWFATIQHGTGPHPVWGNPQTDGRYCIVYLPKKTLEDAQAWWAARPFEILQQDVLAHRLYDRREDMAMTIRQWKGASIMSGRE